MSRLNGDKVKRLPNNVNVSFQFIEGESMLLMLDQSASVHPAVLHVHPVLWIRLMYFLQSVFLMRLHRLSALTLSEETTMEDVDFVVDKLKDIVQT